MRWFGFDLTRRSKGLELITHLPQRTDGGWLGTVRESFGGAWQRNIELTTTTSLTSSTVWACVARISNDIGKLWLMLVERDEDGIWTETESSAFSPVLRTQNNYQTRIKFFESWMLSKLLHGNTYVLKERDDARGLVTGLHVLDPQRVQVLVAPDGAVFYQLSKDNLSGLREDSITVPAREIIHDVGLTPFHPLVGVSPMYAAGLAANQGLAIQATTTQLASNGLTVSGFLTTPHPLSQAQAEQIENYWAANYTGERNRGRFVAVGDGLEFKAMTSTAIDAQIAEQLKWSEEKICSVYGVPPYKLGIGPMPSYNNIQALNVEYYGTALQEPAEQIEELLDKGLELPTAPRRLGTMFDLSALLRMDTSTQMTVARDAVGAGIMTPNEARALFDLKPVTGGETPYLQVQNYSLSALNKRDSGDPFAPVSPGAALPVGTTPENEAVDDDEAVDVAASFAAAVYRKSMTVGLFT